MSLKDLLSFAGDKLYSFFLFRFIYDEFKYIKNSKKFHDALSFFEKWSLLFQGLYAILICFLMEWLSRHSFSDALLFTQEHTIPFIYNSFVIWATFLVVYIFPKRASVRLFLSFIFIFLGVINCVVLLNRVSPFGFTDFTMINDLLTMKNTQYFTSTQAFFVVFVIVCIFIFIIFLAVTGKSVKSRLKLPIRIILVTIGLSFIPLSTKVLQQNNKLATYFGNLAQGYSDYGLLYGFNMSLFLRGVQKPILYSKDVVDRILIDTDMGDSTIDPENTPNIIVILLESFYDVRETKFLKPSREVTPYFNYLMDNYSSGYLTVPVVGAGTCNSEFEVLTGMSCKFFGPGEYPQKTILKEVDSCESVADVVKNLGYKTHVVHNNGGNFYSRKNAFSKMGFDTFTSKEMLDIREWNPLGSWPMDYILTDATKDALDSTEGPDFVYTITVQTHGDYPTRKVISYPTIKVDCENKSFEETFQWEYYLNMLRKEDDFIEQYIQMISERDEPTLVIMFGDHLPTLGLNPDDQNNRNLFLTNYATWNNFGMEKEDQDLATFQLVSEYFDRLGIHGGNLVDYNQYMTKNGTPANSLVYQNGIHNLQYDILYGDRYVYNGGDDYPATDIVMGVKDVHINKIYSFNNTLHIYGENFTPWSSVFSGDNIVKTSYRSGECLTVNLEDLENGKPIRVCQMGSGNSIFRSSNMIYYFD